MIDSKGMENFLDRKILPIGGVAWGRVWDQWECMSSF